MKFAILSTILLAGSALAAPTNLVARDTIVIERAIQQFDYALNDLYNTIRQKPTRYNNASPDQFLNKVFSSSGNARNVLRDWTYQIARGPSVNTFESFDLPSRVQNTLRALQDVSREWIDIKDIVKQLNAQQAVIGELQYFQVDMGQYMDAINAKLGALVRPAGTSAKTQFNNELQKIITAYNRRY